MFWIRRYEKREEGKFNTIESPFWMLNGSNCKTESYSNVRDLFFTKWARYRFYKWLLCPVSIECLFHVPLLTSRSKSRTVFSDCSNFPNQCSSFCFNKDFDPTILMINFKTFQSLIKVYSVVDGIKNKKQRTEILYHPLRLIIKITK